MRKTTVGLLVVVTVVATVAGGLVAADVGHGSAEAQDLLPLEDQSDRHAHGASADFGAAAVATDAMLRAELEHRTLTAELESATPENRSAIAQAYLDRLDAEVTSLVETDREAVAAVVDGDSTIGDLMRSVYTTGAIATARQQTLDELESLEAALPEIDLTGEAARLDHRYDLVSGPVRDRLVMAATTPDRQTTVGVELTAEGLVLTAVDASRFYREAIRFDRLTLAGVAQLSLSEAETVVTDTYPSSTATRATRDLGSGVYLVERSLPDGSVTAYVDGDPAAVAVERQYRWLDQLELSQANAVTEDGIELTLERSFEGGPLRVSAVDAGSGEPVDASVYLRHGGTWSPLGALDASGVVWGADPGGPLDVRVVTPDGIVSLSVDR